MNETMQEILSYYKARGAAKDQQELTALLYEVQEHLGCVPDDVQRTIAEELGIRPAAIAALVRLYPSLQPAAARHTITVCLGPRCQNKASPNLLRHIEQLLGIRPGGHTPDGRFALRTSDCMHHCGTSPNLRIDDDHYGGVTPEQVTALLSRYP